MAERARRAYETIIRADADTVYRLVAELELWPALIPHIKSARVVERLGRHRRIVTVRASWRGLPVGWRAIQLSEPERRRVTFRHLIAATRGTTVSWTVEPAGEDTVRLRVEQQVRLARFVPGRSLVRAIVTERIGPEMARRMLERIREIAEGGSLAGPD
ncbi:MAG: SRPBCC family protein [Chloroflexi bacterium]|nr:SRPBCC family protein [Chloroflexota bacterium]